MRFSTNRAIALAAATMGTVAHGESLSSLCTLSKVKDALPANGDILGVDMISSSVTAKAIYNGTTGGGMGSSDSTSSATYNYCNVTVAYKHTGRDDKVVLKLVFPEPTTFENRLYVAGGGSFSLSSDATGGLPYGAASGATDAGYDAFTTSYDEVALYGNGSLNWDATYMFSYQALGEMVQVGKAITKALYDEKKLYTYYEGCSDGGREGMSQVQRWAGEYDGVITGAPAYHFAHTQVQHIFPNTVEKTLDYYPPPCEIAKIVNATIKACDPLDGRKDGVILRSDLCKLHFNLSGIVGESYSCAEQNYTSLGYSFNKVKRQAAGGGNEGSSTSYEPAQNGTVSAKGVAVAQAIYDGLHNSQGQRAFVSWQIGSELSDADTAYNQDSDKLELDEFDCVFDQKSYDSWPTELLAFKTPIY